MQTFAKLLWTLVYYWDVSVTPIHSDLLGQRWAVYRACRNWHIYGRRTLWSHKFWFIYLFNRARPLFTCFRCECPQSIIHCL